MNIENKDITHSNLNFLKELERYTFDSKMIFCQKYSNRLMSCSEVDMNLAVQENVMPWELEVLALFSVVYDSDNAQSVFNEKIFGEMITKIRNFWHPELIIAEKNGMYTEAYMMISMLHQFPIQGEILKKLFRYNYFFNFHNDKINMMPKFKDKFNINYEELELFGFIFFIVMSKDAGKRINNFTREIIFKKLFSSEKIMEILSIEKYEYKEKLKNLYNDNDLDYYYGLKIQYQYPFIVGKEYIYIPSPYLVINAVTESLLNRLTFGDNELRNKFGKEVVENYFYSIYSEISSIEWITTEITYKIGKQEFRTPDILVGEGNYCVFFDTKALTPSLKIRRFDKVEIENEINLYAESIVQIYIQILNYIDKNFKLNCDYEKNNIFGIVVVLEDAYISRKDIYSKVFEMLSSKNIEDKEEIKNYIHSHIKIVPLREIEDNVLEGYSYLPVLLKQVYEPDRWDDYTYNLTRENPHLIDSYRRYVDEIKSKASLFVKQMNR